MAYTEQNHTFVICAYEESPYLEKCVSSVVKQTIKSNVIMSTSTPNDYIKKIAQKYQLRLAINPGKGNACSNWNFALSQTDTELVTLCHQDDCYAPEYLENALTCLNTAKKPMLYFTDYQEIREDKIIGQNKLLKIKRMMLLPLKCALFQRSRFIRRLILSIGCAICCPSVTYVKENLEFPIFTDEFHGNIDWQAWEKISKGKGDFVYCSKPLTFHRIHADSTTSITIGDGVRIKEDYEMFCKFWPKHIARMLTKIYSTSEKSNAI